MRDVRAQNVSRNRRQVVPEMRVDATEVDGRLRHRHSRAVAGVLDVGSEKLFESDQPKQEQQAMTL